MPDPNPALTRAFGPIAAFGGRMLRVVYRPQGDDRGHGHVGSRSPAMIRTNYDPEADVRDIAFGPADAVSDEHQEVAPGVYVEAISVGLRQ